MKVFRNWSVNKPVFISVSVVIIVAVALTRIFNRSLEELLHKVQLYITSQLGWVLPEFSKATWFAMLFSTGMGIGILFYGISEPLLHFRHPPQARTNDIALARQAMSLQRSRKDALLESSSPACCWCLHC